MCVKGARWVREHILEEHPDEDLVVYAVWFNMVATDRKARWDPDLLGDKRVRHYWDEDRVLGAWISKNLPDHNHLGAIDWDSYYLFDTDGNWDDTFENVRASGTPIAKSTEKLEQAFDLMLK